jgi:hypothetical protein
MDKKQRIANELRSIIKAPSEFSDEQIMKITEESFLKASVEFSFTVAAEDLTPIKELPIKLKNFINKKS